jgi:hypothetical protein
MTSPARFSDQMIYASIGVAFGAVVGLVLAALSTWILDTSSISKVSVLVSTLAFGVLGALRGPEVGDAAGITLHAVFKLLVPLGNDFETPHGTFSPRNLALLVALLAIASLVSAALGLP